METPNDERPSTEYGSMLNQVIKNTSYTGVVSTTDKLFAGTDATVKLWLTDCSERCIGPIRKGDKYP